MTKSQFKTHAAQTTTATATEIERLAQTMVKDGLLQEDEPVKSIGEQVAKECVSFGPDSGEIRFREESPILFDTMDCSIAWAQHVIAALGDECIRRDREQRYDIFNFIEAHAKWSRETFGSDDECGPIGPLNHLVKEAKECVAAPYDLIEKADSFMLVLDATRRSKRSFEDLLAACWQKLEINKERKWDKPGDDGAVHHVKDDAGEQRAAKPAEPVDYEEAAKRYVHKSDVDGFVIGGDVSHGIAAPNNSEEWIIRFLSTILRDFDARTGGKPVHRETPEQVAEKMVRATLDGTLTGTSVGLKGGEQFDSKDERGRILRVLASIIRADRASVQDEPVSKYPKWTWWIGSGVSAGCVLYSDGKKFFVQPSGEPIEFADYEAQYGGLYQCDSTGQRIEPVSNNEGKVQA